MDIGLPDGDGAEAVRDLLSKRPGTKVVVLTIHDSDEHLFKALANGAKGFMLKNTPAMKLIASLRAVERGEVALTRLMTGRVMDKLSRLANVHGRAGAGHSSLTTRELDILKMLVSDATNQEIAEKLVIAENTVKVHIHNILEKLHVKNRREAARIARERGLIEQTEMDR
jgi:DNA-binding NarL/FixJ family response regulator